MDTPSASSSSTAIADAEPTMIRRRRIQWFGGPAMKQNFSLPPSLMYYIAKNPSNPQVYNKLIQTCKFFFERNPIIVAAFMTEEDICSNDECYGSGRCCVKMDITKISSKIWITHRLRIDQNNIPNFSELLRPKIYRCDISYLSFHQITVDFDDFKFFGLSAKQIELERIKIVNNGALVLLENILEELPEVEEFQWRENDTSMVSASTAKNISKLKNLKNLKLMKLWNIHEAFNIENLFDFFKDQSDIKFLFHFAFDISEEYKNQLDQFIDTLIESQLSNCFITYSDQNHEKFNILFKRFFDDLLVL